MATLREVMQEGGYIAAPQIEEQKVKLLWASGWYDGPTFGLCLYNEKKFWFQQDGYDDFNHDRIDESGVRFRDYFKRYFLVELTDAQLKDAEHWHSLFKEKVGDYMDFDELGNRPKAQVKDTSDEFFEMVKTRPKTDYSNTKVIGCYEFLWGTLDEDETRNDK